jgi:hypothetical protein
VADGGVPDPSPTPSAKPGLRCYAAKGRCGPEGLKGLTEAEVEARYGPPHRREGSRWSYMLPRGCAYEKDELTVYFVRGRVVRATANHRFTGQHCM